jgi:integrase
MRCATGVLAKLGQEQCVDVRSPEEYRGERLAPEHLPQEQAQVPGHIPGAVNILAGARRRAGLERGTCHELRHTCLTRLREAGMALEAIQAQAGHRSIESTRVYLHLTNDWLAGEYQRAAELIDGTAVAELVAAQEPRR